MAIERVPNSIITDHHQVKTSQYAASAFAICTKKGEGSQCLHRIQNNIQ